MSLILDFLQTLQENTLFLNEYESVVKISKERYFRIPESSSPENSSPGKFFAPATALLQEFSGGECLVNFLKRYQSFFL
jgi:hypothetical protein